MVNQVSVYLFFLFVGGWQFGCFIDVILLGIDIEVIDGVYGWLGEFILLGEMVFCYVLYWQYVIILC